MQREGQIHMVGGKTREISAMGKGSISVCQNICSLESFRMGGFGFMIGKGGWINMFLFYMAFVIPTVGKIWGKSLGDGGPAPFYKVPTMVQILYSVDKGYCYDS